MMNEGPIEFTLRSYPRFPRNWYYPKFRLATWHSTGVLTDAVADQIIEFVEMQEHDQEELFDRYTGFSGLTQVRLKVDHMFEIARRRQSAREPVNSAFFADHKAVSTFIKGQISYRSLYFYYSFRFLYVNKNLYFSKL